MQRPPAADGAAAPVPARSAADEHVLERAFAQALRRTDDSFADRQRVAYRYPGHNQDGPFVVEQQAYYTESDGRINWMRVLCSGFRPR